MSVCANWTLPLDEVIRLSTKTKRKPKPKADVQCVAQVDPNWGRQLVWCNPVAGVHVNEFTVLNVATVVACCRYIATSIAQTDYNVYERLPDGGKFYQPDNSVDWIIDKEANPETPAIVFWETIILHVLIWGNGYAEIQRDVYGRVLWLWQITPTE